LIAESSPALVPTLSSTSWKGVSISLAAEDYCDSDKGGTEDRSHNGSTCLPAPWHVLPKHSSMPCCVPVSTYEHVPIVPRNESSQGDLQQLVVIALLERTNRLQVKYRALLPTTQQRCDTVRWGVLHQVRARSKIVPPIRTGWPMNW
jgi:hypothetical protein